jgi:hypothetical protein
LLAERNAGLIIITMPLLLLNNVKRVFNGFSLKLSLLHEQKNVVNINCINGIGAFGVNSDPNQPHQNGI